MVARTPYFDVLDKGVRVLSANLPVQPGDLVGLAVTPRAAGGIRGVRGGPTHPWVGALRYTGGAPGKGPGPGVDAGAPPPGREDWVPGVCWRLPGAVAGADAASAPPGGVAGRYILRRGASPAALVVARIRGKVAADLIVGGRRLVRLPVESARSDGELQAIE